MSNKQRVAEKCEALWRHATKNRKPKHSTEADRKREGTYTNGFRNEIETWTLEQGTYTIRATRACWQTFNLAADTEGIRRILEILKSNKVVFKATEEGAGTRKNFGAEERYIGTDPIPAKHWKVDEGKVPSALEKIAA